MYIKVFCFALLPIIVSCSKKSKSPVQDPLISTDMANGLGDNPNAINGYFYVAQRDYGSSTIYTTIYASFSDPKKKLMTGYNHFNENSSFSSNNTQGNIDVGNIFFNNWLFLNKNSFNPNVTYSANNSNGSYSSSAAWKTDGNMSFKPLDLIVSRGFPTVSTTTFAPISKSAGCTINLSTYANNYDSLTVVITDNSSTQIKRRVDATVSSITFSSAELNQLYSNYGSVWFYAYNYSNKTVENKSYIFELSYKTTKPVNLNP
jgi:hypothetical protein